jgi:hypothetical protein
LRQISKSLNQEIRNPLLILRFSDLAIAFDVSLATNLKIPTSGNPKSIADFAI